MSDTPRTPSGYETAANLGNEVDTLRRELAAAQTKIERLRELALLVCDATDSIGLHSVNALRAELEKYNGRL